MAVYVKEVVGKDETVAKVYVLQGGITNTDWIEWPFGSGSGSSITVENEGSELTTNVQQFDFTGDGVTASSSGNDVTVNIPGAEPEIITVKKTFGQSDFLAFSQGAQTLLILDPPNAELGKFYNIINIHCRFKPSINNYNVSGDGITSIYYDGEDKSTGAKIPDSYFELSGVSPHAYFAYSNPLADPSRDGELRNSWNISGSLVLGTDQLFEDSKGQAAGTLEVWVTYTLTSLT